LLLLLLSTEDMVDKSQPTLLSQQDSWTVVISLLTINYVRIWIHLWSQYLKIVSGLLTSTGVLFLFTMNSFTSVGVKSFIFQVTSCTEIKCLIHIQISLTSTVFKVQIYYVSNRSLLFHYLIICFIAQFDGSSGERMKQAYGDFCSHHIEAVALYKVSTLNFVSKQCSEIS